MSVRLLMGFNSQICSLLFDTKQTKSKKNVYFNQELRMM